MTDDRSIEDTSGPTYDDDADIPLDDQAPQADSQPATVAEGAEDMAKNKTRGRKAAAQKVATVKAPRKARAVHGPSVKAAKVEKAIRPLKTRSNDTSVLAGIRKAPKNKILFLNTDVALAVVRKALQAMLPDFAEAERREAERLLARIAARS